MLRKSAGNFGKICVIAAHNLTTLTWGNYYSNFNEGEIGNIF